MSDCKLSLHYCPLDFKCDGTKIKASNLLEMKTVDYNEEHDKVRN